MIKAIFIAFLLTTSTALAQSEIACNAYGAVVELDTGELFYLGNKCDAILEGVGKGKWFLTASAFAVEIEDRSYLLPNEVDCNLPACWYDGLDE